MTDTVTERTFSYDALDPGDAAELKEIEGRIRVHAKRSIAEDLAIGSELLRAQEKLSRGRNGIFVAWVEERLGMSWSHAFRLMEISRRLPDFCSIEQVSDSETAVLPLFEILKSNTPPAVRDELLSRIEAGERVRYRDVTAAKAVAAMAVGIVDRGDDDDDRDDDTLDSVSLSLPFPYPDGLHATADDERIAEADRRLRDEREASKTKQLRDETELLTKTRAFFREHEEDMAPERLLLRVKNATHEALAMAYDFEEIGNDRVFEAMRGNPQQVAELSRMIDACQRAIKFARIVVPASAGGLRRVV